MPATASRDPTAPATDLRERSTAPVHHVWAGTGPVHPTVVRGGRGNARNPTDLPMAAAHYRRRQRTLDAISSPLRVDFILLATKAQPLACDNARNHVELDSLAVVLAHLSKSNLSLCLNCLFVSLALLCVRYVCQDSS